MKKKKKKILAISGSTRKDSSNEKLIKFIGEISSELFKISSFDISSLPYFNQDTDNSKIPKTVKAFREAIEDADGVLICTPEYVFSIPGILKNAIEWTVSTVVFSDKPTAIITASSSGIKAHESLLLVMKTVGAKMSDTSALLIQSIKSKTNKEGRLTDLSTLQQLEELIHSLNNSI
jgi:NAD(P)H-dependent FMN reductase